MLNFVLVGFFIFLGIFLIINELDIKKQVLAVKRYGEKVNIRSKEARVKTGYDGVLKRIESKIQQSNIRYYFPFYSVWLHLVLSFIAMSVAFIWMRSLLPLLVSVCFAAGAFFFPFVILQIVVDLMKARIKKVSLDFLITLKNFFIAGEKQDIINALKRTSKYVGQPLKSYLELFIYEHEYKINPIICIENLINRVNIGELKMYLENLKVCYLYGGSVVALTDTFIEEIGEIQTLEAEEDSEDAALNTGLYLLLSHFPTNSL